jgi:hypothetical protein
MVKVVLFPGGRQTPMRVNLRLTPCGALSRHRCRGVRLRKHARLYYKMPADGPGGRLDLLVDPSSNLSTKYTFPAYISFRELACMPHTVSRSRSRALLGTVGQYFIVPFGTRGCRPKGSLYRRRPTSRWNDTDAGQIFRNVPFAHALPRPGRRKGTGLRSTSIFCRRLLRCCSVCGHQSEIVFCVLVVVFCPDDIPGSRFFLG